MKIKLLDYTLISLLAGVPLQAISQEVPQSQSNDGRIADEAGPADCGGEDCEDGLFFRLRTRSYDKPVTSGTSATSTADELQPDRRVEVAVESPGVATVAGKFSVSLPNGGMIWATEDPNFGQAELSISAPATVAYDGRKIVVPVQFYVRSNYPAFVQRYEVTLYRSEDADLIDPVARFQLPVTGVSQGQWNGDLPPDRRFRVGDELVYVLRAYDANGRFDETWPRTLRIVSLDEAERNNQHLRDSVEKALGTSLTGTQAQDSRLLNNVFSENTLRLQNIPLSGSRVRLQGRNIPEDYRLKIDGNDYPVDLERKFVGEYLVPVGRHRFDLQLDGRDGKSLRHALDVDVSGEYFFGVGLADVTIYKNSVGGPSDPFRNDVSYSDDILTNGRLAFYMKAKRRGRYLITAQADTTERDLEELFDGFTRADPQDLFRRLDPDLYYPVYGDDSTTWRDVDTQGRFYLRMDWDRSQALWGNYATDLAETEYAQYVRSLYGAALDWRSRTTNVWGDPGSALRLFASEAQTAPGHTEFLGTGGSLYYLRHTDIMPGSEKLVLEVRDRSTGRVESRTELRSGVDYEIDNLQGRLLLTRPLTQTANENVPVLTRDVPQGRLEQRLIVDYEWIPSGFDADEVTMGLRGKHWFGDHVGLGATWVDENRAGEDYTLKGVDLTLQAGKGTWLKVEHSETEATSLPVFFSDNGGFSFTQINDPAGLRGGEATAVDARANFRELGWSTLDLSAGAWWRRADAGYSVSRFDIGADIEEYGAEMLGRFSEGLGLYARYSHAERGAESLEQAQLTGEWRIGENDTFSAELRWVEEQRDGDSAAGVLGALKYNRRFGDRLDLYGIGQVTVDDDGGAYADNDAYTLGGKYLYGDLSSIGAEVTSGDRGDAAKVNAEYRISQDRTVYGGYTFSTDTTTYDSLFNPNTQNGWTLGQRWRLSDKVSMFNESQQLKSRSESGLGHTFGLDFLPAQGWNLGFAIGFGDLTSVLGAQVERRSVSVHGGRTSQDTDWQSKLEWRRDSGAERREQWVSTNRLTHKINESWRIAARVNYADTEDETNSAASARFIESNIGFAWRPWDNQRWAAFGRYTYLYDLSTLGQSGGAKYDQKSQVLSLEGVYKPDAQWEFATKLAQREGEVRYARGSGPWFDSSTTFVAGQVRYDLRQQWHALAEYRWLDVKDGGTRQGWLVGVDRDVGKNFRIGVGYNFTDFSDDLTDFDYDHRGWFVNLVGKY